MPASRAAVLAKLRAAGVTPADLEEIGSVPDDECRAVIEAKEDAECARDVAYWVANHWWTCDQRKGGQPERFRPWPKQVEFLRWLEDLERKAAPEDGRGDGVVEKSRDWGATVLCCAFAVHRWLYHAGSAVGLGSRKLELVDSKGDPKCIFEKIRYGLYRLPPRMLPPRFKRSEHDLEAKLINPANGSTITGEGGENVGRGGRYAQPLDAKILTPTGWESMGNMTVGTMVVGSDGSAVRVTGVHPQGIREVFRVTFNDGSSTECTDDHLWHVTTPKNRKYARRLPGRVYQGVKNEGQPFQVLQLSRIREQLFQTKKDGTREAIYQIPVMRAAQFQRQPLPLYPYLLGVLLGDGDVSRNQTSAPTLTTADAEMAELVAERLPEHCEVAPTGALYGYRLRDPRGARGRGHRSPVKKAVEDLGLSGKVSYDKFVPGIYKFADPSSRLEVLRGLLDTDGWASARSGGSRVGFCSTSERLAADVAFLVNSLGGVATTVRRERRMARLPQGSYCLSAPRFEMAITMPTGMCPFRLKRKASLYRERVKYRPRRSIVSVEPLGLKECQCITVDAPDRLYVTDDCVVTHNSHYFCDEKAYMPNADSVDRSLSQATRFQVDVSTPNGQGENFWRKRFSGRAAVFVCDWRDDPRKNTRVTLDDGRVVYPWYEAQKKAFDAVTVAQEVDRDYTASVEGVCIPGTWVRAAVGLELPGAGAFDDTWGGLDVGGGTLATTVLAVRRGPRVLPLTAYTGPNVVVVAWRVKDDAERLGVQSLALEHTGVGTGPKGTWESAEPDRRPRFDVRALNTGSPATLDRWPDGRTAREKFLNIRAEAWWGLRERFRKTHEWVNGEESHPVEELISIPDDPELITQLSMPLAEPASSGRVKIESKKDMRRRGVSSPDRADAVVLAFFEGKRSVYESRGIRCLGDGPAEPALAAAGPAPADGLPVQSEDRFWRWD